MLCIMLPDYDFLKTLHENRSSGVLMRSLLRRLADRGRTIILVTHATNNINACDYVCFLAQGGRVAYFGPPNEAKKFFNKDDFAEIYTSLEPSEANPNIPAEAE